MVFAVGVDDALHARFCTKAARRPCDALEWRAHADDAKRVVLEAAEKQRVLVFSAAEACADARVAKLGAVVDDELGFAASTSTSTKSSIKSTKKSPPALSPATMFVCVRGGEDAAPAPPLGFLHTEPVPDAATAKVRRRQTGATLTAPAFGIKKLWVHPDARKRGVASSLLSAARSHFGYPAPVPVSSVAISAPSPAGAAWASRALGVDFMLYD